MELGPPTCPPETFTNILLMCCKHEMYDTAADILAENTHLTYKYLSSVSGRVGVEGGFKNNLKELIII